jgi:hypothetical protein
LGGKLLSVDCGRIDELQELAGPLPESYVDFLEVMGQQVPGILDLDVGGDVSIATVLRYYRIPKDRSGEALENFGKYLVVGRGSAVVEDLLLSRDTGTVHWGGCMIPCRRTPARFSTRLAAQAKSRVPIVEY